MNSEGPKNWTML